MQIFLVCLGVVAVGEIGDKTQLLALLLAARFRQPVPIVLGILVATLFNHALAGLVGAWVAHVMDPRILRWVVGASFIAIGLWALVPDRMEDEAGALRGRFGVFWVTTVSFFLAEIGDKTQLATVALAARYDHLAAVVAGTTCGMLLADVPAVLLADRAAARLPLRAIRRVAAALFILLGASALWSGFSL